MVRKLYNFDIKNLIFEIYFLAKIQKEINN